MPRRFRTLLQRLDPRRSLATAIAWLLVLLSLGLGVVAGAWAGKLTHESLLEERAERAANAAEQWSNGIDAALAQRRQPLQAAAAMMPAAVLAGDTPRLALVLRDLQVRYPEFGWIGLTDAQGRLLAATPAQPAAGGGNGGSGAALAQQAWFRAGLRQPWVSAAPADFIALALPVLDAQHHTLGVLGAHLGWNWLAQAAEQARRRVPFLAADVSALLLDAGDRVLIGPDSLRGGLWQGRPESDSPLRGVLRLPDGSRAGFASGRALAGGMLSQLGWRVLLVQPLAGARRHADRVRREIMWLSLALGAGVALVGAALARRLTRRLTGLAAAVQAVSPGARQAIAVPPGDDEVGRLGRAFNGLLGSLQRERDALGALSAQLEQRVQARTREVERLAEEARYAAVVRERLRIARELHDTLAHSMMAMLAQVRVLRKLHARDPQALAAELERAEQAARQGLNEARAAITQMRFNGARDLGLGPALAGVVQQFTARTGLPVDYAAGPRAAAFADERAEALFRMAEEGLRNIERHAGATRVQVLLQDVEGSQVQLSIADDGVGFDPQQRQPGHYGLVGLREQAQLVGAALHIVSAPGRGTTLQLRLRSEPDLEP